MLPKTNINKQRWYEFIKINKQIIYAVYKRSIVHRLGQRWPVVFGQLLRVKTRRKIDALVIDIFQLELIGFSDVT